MFRGGSDSGTGAGARDLPRGDASCLVCAPQSHAEKFFNSSARAARARGESSMRSARSLTYREGLGKVSKLWKDDKIIANT